MGLDQATEDLRQSGASTDQQHCDDRSVYALSSQADPETVKIGVSQDVGARRKSLQSGSGPPLVVRWTSSGGGWLEDRLHGRFAARALGREWFDFRDTADPVQMIAQAVQELLRQAGTTSPAPALRKTVRPRQQGAATGAARC
ncbi:GIY-YIG nuclease family protein [Streptomyces sp. NPDC059629]|uniref:GIY-YIG nuclease family protein n=1 Tax=Streptomyces sp. NPDC059629 TaxID=3346889 RepID=UPI0036772E90